MNVMHSPAQRKAAATYNAAADHFDQPPLAFWDRHGQHTVTLLALAEGARVLDVGCGTGASALPAAAGAVGPKGQVLGIDLAEKMLQRAQEKAKWQGLGNAVFQIGDMTRIEQPDDSFDAVISVFSVFFVPEVERQMTVLWRLVRPGGQLAVTVWGPDAFEPWATAFREEISLLRPDLSVGTRPWERLTSVDLLRQLFLDAGLPEPSITEAPDCQPMSEPGDFWTLALGSGYRWEIDQLSEAEGRQLWHRMLDRLSGAKTLETSALIAVLRKSQ